MAGECRKPDVAAPFARAGAEMAAGAKVVKVTVVRPRARRFDIKGPDGAVLDSPETRAATEAALEVLRDKLAKQGVKLDIDWKVG